MIGFITPFQILDYLDRLNVVKETSREYHCLCPVCGDGGFKVNKKDGKYQGFKCRCEVKEIREAIRPWDEVKALGQREKVKEKREQTTTKSNQKLELAQLPLPAIDSPTPKTDAIAEWLVKQGVPASASETRYWYSKTQWVSKFEWQTESGQEKTIRQGHIKSNGLVQWKKGGKDWLAYKLTEAAKHSSGNWVLGVEGEGCVESAREIALSAITWQGSNWQVQRIVKDLTKLIAAGAAGLVYFPDRDEAGEKKAELVEQACQEVGLPCLILCPTDVWADMPPKGDITDWIKAHPNFSTNELISKLDKAIAIAYRRQEQERSDREQEEKLASLPNWSQSDIAEYLAEKYQSSLAWNTQEQEWYYYGSLRSGIWTVSSTERIGKLVKSEIGAIANKIALVSNKKPTYTISFINGVTALLKFDLEVDKWNEAEGLLPLLNGVLDLESKKLLLHSPENKLTWCLPYEYNPLATASPIQEWLLTMCGGDGDLVQLMRAYLLGIVTGRTDWQKYLELVGPGGTGKGTFTRLATMLVGQENVHTTTLHKLEKSKFETASIAGKRLVLINDSERYAGEISKLKNLTGQDTLPYEVKFKQSKGGFTPDALVIVTTNEVIQSADYTSGLARRRISIPMFNKIESDRQKNLIEVRSGKIRGEFLPYIPGLLNWVLEMDSKSATSIVKNYEVKVPSLLAMKARTLVETNPIADWLDNFVVYEREAKTNIGVAKRDKDGLSPFWYLNTAQWLYPNYCEYCHNSGTRPVSLRRFVSLLSDLGNNQLGLDIRKERDREGSYFVGLKIRDDADDSPPMITGNAEIVVNVEPSSKNTNVINKLWTMVMDKVMDVMDYVMDESIDGDGCDECDGIFQNFPKIKNNVENKVVCNTKTESDLEKKTSSNEVSNMPLCEAVSFRTPPSPKETETQTQPKVNDSQSAISVGDCVTVEDCPGHWSWASPFTVEAIEGELVKLEMVDESIKIERLSAVDG